MQSEFTLGDDVIAHIKGADKAIKAKSQWSAFDCKIMLNKLEAVANDIQEKYVDLNGITMPDDFKLIYKGIFKGNLKTFINYTNGLLYVRKLQDKIRMIKDKGSLLKSE